MSVDTLWYAYAWLFMHEGILPYAGGWLDQPMYFIETAGYIKSELNKER